MTEPCPGCGAERAPKSACPSCGADANIGRKLGEGGRFLVLGPLGAGGIGSIYRGRDMTSSAEVAIKLLRREVVEDVVIRERFRREALALSSLEHPSIVRVRAFGETEGDLYMVLDLVVGTTLSELGPARGEPIAEDKITILFDQVLSALDACHERGVIHRDLKPSNIMVSSSLDVTLIDFGLARVRAESANINTLTETGTVQGTPRYMAPEQCRGEETTTATDIYATGVVLYEALSGAAPFRGDDAATIMAQHLFVDPPPLDQVVPAISRGLPAIVRAALSKRPEERPTARELRRELSAAFAGTDRVSELSALASERRAAGQLAREQRSLVRASPVDGGVTAEVAVWLPPSERSARVLGAIGAAGLVGLLVPLSESPPEIDPRRAPVVVTSAALLERLDELPRGVAIVIIDVSGPDETTRAIRSGAKDMLLAHAPESDLPPKLRRLLRKVSRS